MGAEVDMKCCATDFVRSIAFRLLRDINAVVVRGQNMIAMASRESGRGDPSAVSCAEFTWSCRPDSPGKSSERTLTMHNDGLPAINTRLSYSGHIGTVRYAGKVDNTTGLWLGIEWDDPTRGKHNGSKDGKQYFHCR